MKIIKNCFSIILAISLSFSNLASSFASGEELTQNDGKRENVYSNVNEGDTAAKEKLDKVNELIENKIAKDVNGDLEEVIDSTDKVDESTDNGDVGNDINPDLQEDNTSDEVLKENEGKTESMDTFLEEGTNGSCTWRKIDEHTAEIVPTNPTIGGKIDGKIWELRTIKGTINVDSRVELPDNSSGLFSGYQASQINIFCDTSNVTDMNNMFYGCVNLENLNIKNMDTSNVTDMNQMFTACNKLLELDLSNFNTSNVTDMNHMFSSCNRLTEVKINKGFDTKKVTNMESMFSGCYALKKIDLSGFDTSEVRDMSCMFSDCKTILALDFGDNIDTSCVTDMRNMFSDCKNLETINFTKSFDTSNVTGMDLMFQGCESLSALDLGQANFNTKSVTNMENMFFECSNLKKINLGEKFITSEVNNMDIMFANCLSITELNLGAGFDTSNVESMATIFYGCESLQALDLGDKFDTSNISDTSGMFYNCKSLKTLDLGANFDTSKVKDMIYMFYNCESLETLNLGDRFDTSSVEDDEDMTGMFENMFSLKKIVLDGVKGKLVNTNLPEISNYDKAMYTGFWVKQNDPSETFSSSEMLNNYNQGNPDTYIWQKSSMIITFYANGGKGNMQEQTINYGEKKPLNKNLFTKDGYCFVCWNTKADETGISYYDEDDFLGMNNENVTLYAQWGTESEPPVEEYTITFDANDGSGKTEDRTAVVGEKVILPGDIFTKKGYKLVGWIDDAGNTYKVASEFLQNKQENIILYAQWEADPDPKPDPDPEPKPDPDSNSNSKPDKEKPTDEKKDKENKSGNKNASKNPKTGILASSGLALLLAASGAYISSKRK